MFSLYIYSFFFILCSALSRQLCCFHFSSSIFWRDVTSENLSVVYRINKKGGIKNGPQRKGRHQEKRGEKSQPCILLQAISNWRILFTILIHGARLRSVGRFLVKSRECFFKSVIAWEKKKKNPAFIRIPIFNLIFIFIVITAERCL